MKNFLMITFVLFLGACSGSGDSSSQSGDTLEGRQRFFQVAGGADADLISLVATRSYDNQVNGYVIWNECENKDMKLFSSQTTLPLSDGEVPGPDFFGFNCTIRVTFDYSSSVPTVEGTFAGDGQERPIDITLESVSKDTFINLMESQSVDFESYFNSQSAFDQRNRLDRMCNDLFDQDCSDVF